VEALDVSENGSKLPRPVHPPVAAVVDDA
jgi:hypothetical protein